MEVIKIQGYDGCLLIKIIDVIGFPQRTCFWGGYEARGAIKVDASSFIFESSFSLSTGNIYEFFISFEECLENVIGTAKFVSFDGANDLSFSVIFEELGHVVIKGSFGNRFLNDNVLNFKFISDQSYLNNTLCDLRRIVNKYGDMRGISNI